MPYAFGGLLLTYKIFIFVMTDEDTCEKFHLSFERFVPPSFLFREKVSPALFQETKRNEGSWSLAHPVRRVGFYFFKKVVWHEVVWLLILMLLHCLSYMKHLICRTICFWYLYVNHMNAPWLTKKKESIQYICALAHAAPLDGVEIPKAEHSPNLLEVVH